MLCYWLLAKAPDELPPKEPKMPREAAAPANPKAPLLKKHPPPLPIDVDLRYCEARLNTDFRGLEVWLHAYIRLAIRIFQEVPPVFRGHERYIRPMGSYRYALKVSSCRLGVVEGNRHASEEPSTRPNSEVVRRKLPSRERRKVPSEFRRKQRQFRGTYALADGRRLDD